MKIAITAYHPETGKVHDMAPKDLTEFCEWVVRGRAYGFKAFPMPNGITRFVSNEPGHSHCVFSAKAIEAECAIDYVNWER